MKVSTNTPELLVLDHVPWLMGLISVALIIVPAGVGLNMLGTGDMQGLLVLLGGLVLGAGAFVGFVQRTRLTLDRRTGRADLRQRGVLGTQEHSWELTDVAGAFAERDERSEDGDTWRPALRLNDGTTPPILSSFASGTGAKTTAKVVNNWLGKGSQD